MHHLLFSRNSRTLLLRDCAAVAADGASCFSDNTTDDSSRVCGGATFRLSQMGGDLVLTILVLAVQQREGVCRRGHGTRLVDALKRLLAKEAAARSLRGRMLAQAPKCSHSKYTAAMYLQSW